MPRLNLAQASAVYSDEYPVVKNLKKKIAALKHAIAAAPQPAQRPTKRHRRMSIS